MTLGMLALVLSNCLLVSLFDLRERRAPDVLTLGGLGLTLGLQAFVAWSSLGAAIAGAALGAGVLFLARKLTRGGLGLGDVKFAAFLGAALQPRLLLVCLLISAILALAFAGISYILGKFQKGRSLPFVPFLAGGGLVAILMEQLGLFVFR